MSSVATPNGAEAIGTISSSGSFTGKVRHYPIATTYGTQISNGDFVTIVAGGGVEKNVVTDTATAVTLGIFMGCSYTDPTTGQFTQSNYWPASNAATDAVAYVNDDPHVLFRMQADGTVAAADRGLNSAIVVTAGNTAIGRSRNALDQSELAATATLPLRVVDFIDGPDSAAGDAFTDLVCMFNVHFYRQATGI
jgi:hypothetical protein